MSEISTTSEEASFFVPVIPRFLSTFIFHLSYLEKTGRQKRTCITKKQVYRVYRVYRVYWEN